MRIQALMAGAAVALVAAAASVSANAAELVSNGGFESGLTGWTASGNTGYSTVLNESVHSGVAAYRNGAVGSPGFLSQTVATIAGQSYNYSFWLQNDGGNPNAFSASLGGVVLTALSDAASFGFTHFSGTIVAASNNAAYTFSFRQDPNYWRLDDVSLTSAVGGVPEPASWALMITGFLGAGAAIRANRRRQAALTA